MRRAISWLIAAATRKQVYEKKYSKMVNWRVNMITLTLPTQSNFTDYDVKRILNQWFKWANYNYGLNNYVWKAEVQQRGELHIHIISDCYIHHTNVRYSWNHLLSKYNLLNGHSDPNSTDIHAVLDCQVKDLTAYVVDYMQKKEKQADGTDLRLIKGRLWSCSRALSNAGKVYMNLEEHECESLHKAFIDSNWNCHQIPDTSCFMYMITGFKSLYNYINKQDIIYGLYQNELKLIRSSNKQLMLFERNLIKPNGG